MGFGGASCPMRPLFSLAQRVIRSFAQALNFTTVKALILDLKPCTGGFGCA